MRNYKKSILSALVIVTSLGITQAHAQDQSNFSNQQTSFLSDPQIRLGVTGGTLGVGPEIGARWNNWGVRANATFLTFGYATTRNNVQYNANAHLQTGGITGDWYPWNGGFRLSGGLRFGDNNVDFSAQPQTNISFNLNGHSYSTSDVNSVHGTAHFNPVMPYLGLGYDWNVWRNLTVSLDAGAIYQGQSSLNLQASGPLSSNPLVQQDLNHESSRLRGYLNNAQVYPVVQLGVGWHF